MAPFRRRCPCSATPFSCETARVGACRLQAVVVQYGPVALVEGASATVAQIVRCNRQAVGPDNLGHAAQLPQRSLKSAHQSRERLPNIPLKFEKDTRAAAPSIPRSDPNESANFAALVKRAISSSCQSLNTWALTLDSDTHWSLPICTNIFSVCPFHF